jgi:hypothetical protein
MTPQTQYHEQQPVAHPEFLANTDLAPLPSRGIFYPNGKDHVVIEHMTAHDENILTTPNFINSGTVLEQLLRKKVKDNINIDMLLTGDINAILLQLRIGAYGADYPVKVVDPENGDEFEEIVDLTKLKFKELTIMPDADFLYSFTLLIKKKQIKFRLLTNKEEKDIANKAEDYKKVNGGIDITFTERLKSQIMEVDGDRNKIYISRFVDSMPPLDALRLRNYMSEVEPNLDLSYEFTNPNTGRRFRSIVFLSARLFYPAA